MITKGGGREWQKGGGGGQCRSDRIEMMYKQTSIGGK